MKNIEKRLRVVERAQKQQDKRLGIIERWINFWETVPTPWETVPTPWKKIKKQK